MKKVTFKSYQCLFIFYGLFCALRIGTEYNKYILWYKYFYYCVINLFLMLYGFERVMKNSN